MTAIPKHSFQNRIFFYGLFAVISILAFWLVSDFIGIIAFSFVMVIVLKPVHDWYMRLFGNRATLSTVLTIITLFALLVIPGWLIVTVATNQMEAVIDDIAAGGDPFAVEDIREQVNYAIQQLPIPGIDSFELSEAQVDTVRQAITGAVQWATGLIVYLGMSLPSLLANTFIFLGIVGSLLPNYHRFVARLKRLSPLDDEVDSIYLRKIKAMVWSMFIGIFVIAIIQGLLMGLFYWIGTIPMLGLWTLISIIAAMMPLGASLIALPLGVAQLILGNYFSGVIVLAGYLVIVSNVDNLIRPRLVSKEAYLSFALILLSALGGYQLFGFFGVIYGPVLMILFLTTVDVYQDYYLVETDNGGLPASENRDTDRTDDQETLTPSAPESSESNAAPTAE